MFNVTILNLKDILKYLIELIIVIIIICLCSKMLKKDSTKLMGQTLHVISEVNEEDKEKKQENNIEKNNYLEGFLDTALSYTKITDENYSSTNEKTAEEKPQENESTETTNYAETSNIPPVLPTQVVTNNPIKLTYNAEYKNVKIKNETSYQLTEDVLNPNIEINNKNVILFHTHTCESYTASERYQYTPTGTFRTTDQNFSVVRVGEELKNYLQQYNINTIHDKTYHDYPSYNGSYTRSLETVTNILKTTPSDIVWDVHRDAIGSRSDYAPTVKIGDNDYAAQIMFVIGTNEGGLWHPNWNQNLKFAVRVQQKAEEMYPGLFKPMLLTKSRYNQHASKYAGIIEVGSTGNTLEQCLTSMKYLAKVMNEVLNN